MRIEKSWRTRLLSEAIKKKKKKKEGRNSKIQETFTSSLASIIPLFTWRINFSNYYLPKQAIHPTKDRLQYRNLKSHKARLSRQSTIGELEWLERGHSSRREIEWQPCRKKICYKTYSQGNWMGW